MVVFTCFDYEFLVGLVILSRSYMRNSIVSIWILTFLILSSFLFPNETKAYVDPGAGSYAFQLILGFLFGGLVAIKLFWKNIVGFFKKLFLGKTNDEKSK